MRAAIVACEEGGGVEKGRKKHEGGGGERMEEEQGDAASEREKAGRRSVNNEVKEEELRFFTHLELGLPVCVEVVHFLELLPQEQVELGERCGVFSKGARAREGGAMGGEMFFARSLLAREPKLEF